MRYTATEIERLAAIVYAVIKLKDYLLGRTFKIITDQQALIFLLKTPYHISRLARWSLILAFSYEIVYCKRSENVLADYLSRNVTKMNREKYCKSAFSNGDESLVLCLDMIAAIQRINSWFPDLKNIAKMQREDTRLESLRDEI